MFYLRSHLCIGFCIGDIGNGCSDILKQILGLEMLRMNEVLVEINADIHWNSALIQAGSYKTDSM
jgi:hypothetical protein